MKPFFKWSGGKRRELIHIKPYMPNEYKIYYEPFVGAGALWLDLEPPNAVVNDNYADVINFYNVLKSDTEKLVNEINKLSCNYNNEVAALKENPQLEVQIDNLKDIIGVLSDEKKIKIKKKQLENLKSALKKDFQLIADKYYYHYRDMKFTSDYEKALRFYILRQLSFSGMLRFSADGNYNIPFGWYKKLKGMEHGIDKIKTVLGNTKFLCRDWRSTVNDATVEDFVFLDPPYTTRVFNKYHPSGNFGRVEQMKLADWFKTKQSRALIIINKDEFTEGLYGKYIVDVHDYRYAVQYRDRMKEKDSKVKHLIAKNY